MKKFTFLLTMVGLMFGSTINAQTSLSWKKFKAIGGVVTDLSTLQDGATYAFKSVGKNKFVKIKDNSFDSKQLTNIPELTTDNENVGLAVFTFHKKGEDTYSFESAWKGYYMQPVVDGSCYLGTNEASFVIKNTNVDNKTKEGEGNFCIKNSSNNLWFDMQDGQFVGWQGRGANCWYQIFPVTVDEEASVNYYKATFTASVGDEVLATSAEWLKEGATATTPSSFNDTNKRSYYYTTFTPNFTDATVSANNTNFDFTVSEDGTAPVDFNKSYTLRTRINESDKKDKCFIRANSYRNAEVLEAGNVAFNEASVTTYSDFQNRLWKFVKSGFGVKLYNVGTGKYVKFTSGAATLDKEGTEFYFKKPAASQPNTQFTLGTGAGANTYFGSHACAYTWGNNNDRLGVWNHGSAATDNGSHFTIADVDANEDILTIAKSALKKTLTIDKNDESYLTFDTSNFNELISKVETATDVKALNDIYSSITTTATPDVNAYYRIANVAAADGKAYLTTSNMIVGTDGTLKTAYNANTGIDRKITRTEEANAIVSQLWKFEKIGDNYRIRNANTNNPIAFFNNGDLDMPIDPNYGGSTSIKSVFPNAGTSNNAYWQFANGEQVYGVRGEQYIGTNSDLKNTTNNIWTIQKVSNITVNVSDASYASVAYPFATQIKTEGAKAFYATSANDGMISLNEITDGIIPANQGVLIWKNGGGNVELTITNTENNLEGNILQPSTAKRSGFTAGNTYVLAKNSENAAAFLKSELTVVPANKAYINTDALPADAGAAIGLIFNGGNTTGINSIANSDNNNIEYYDLNGRRVLYPNNGIFVTNTGKKVFIK